jgi:hypothetical protein
MTSEIDYEAANAAIAELVVHKDDYAFEEELFTAGAFVAQFGSFADLFPEELDLTRAQFWVGHRIAAWSMLGHWSVERADPQPQPPGGPEPVSHRHRQEHHSLNPSSGGRQRPPGFKPRYNPFQTRKQSFL